METRHLALLIPALPFLGFLVNGLLGGRFSRRAVHLVACGSTLLSFAAAVTLFLRLSAVPGHRWEHAYFDWISSGTFTARFGLLLDPLSMTMVLVVTGVGFLIHVYSTGYMAREDGFRRFFAYLNLFMAAMLLLVMADNYLLLFVGWEGVGLCSYLLIGYYYHKKSAADAGKKAFIVNRIGDAGFVCGVLLLFATFGRLDFEGLFGGIAALPVETKAGVLTAAALLLFVGAVGKSAQIPLYVWLPDAMEGPTPVSALIHAATMVTAGVYMVARSSALYLHAPRALLAVAVVGVATAVFAAVIGLFQRDIKRVLAYSTVSQLGFMFTALGVCAFTSGIFHLMTHAFFKALLFLGSGSVILALHHEQDLQNMGGIARKTPVTCVTMWFGTLAIAGIPIFSGFFSKDEILFSVFSSGVPGAKALYAIATFAAVLTAFYMFRLMFLAFHGTARMGQDKLSHVHESSKSMTVVLVVLAALSLAGGLVGLPAWVGVNRFHAFLSPVFASGAAPGAHAHPAAHHADEILVTCISVAAALLGALAAWAVYRRQKRTPADEARLGMMHKLIFNKFYVDEIYHALIVRPLFRLSETVFWKWTDVNVIDGIVNGWADVAGAAGKGVSRLQGGITRVYAGWITVGVLAAGLALLMLYLR